MRGFAESGAYDVLAIVHDFPYRSLPGEVEVARTVTRALLDATRDRPEILPVFISLTSGEPTPEVQALLDAAGGVPLLRGAREAELAIARRAWWEARRTARLANGPARPTWRGARGRPDAVRPRRRGRRGGDRRGASGRSAPATRALSEADSLALLRGRRDPGRRGDARRRCRRRRSRPPSGGRPAGRAEARRRGPRPQERRRRGSPRARRSRARSRRPPRSSSSAAGTAGSSSAASSSSRWPRRRLELIVGVTRDPLFGPAVLVGFGGVFTEVLDDAAIRLAPIAHDQALAMVETLRGAPLLGGARGQSAGRPGGAGRPDRRPRPRSPGNGPTCWPSTSTRSSPGADGAIAVDALVVLAGAGR